jgi:hypothetical protein
MQAFLARQQVVFELKGGAHLDGIVCAAAALVGVGLGEAQSDHRGQRIANSIRSISFLSIRPWRLAMAAYGGKRMGGGQINCSIPCQPVSGGGPGAPVLQPTQYPAPPQSGPQSDISRDGQQDQPQR